MQCSFCGHDVPFGAPRCPRCGGAVAAPGQDPATVFSSVEVSRPAFGASPPPPPGLSSPDPEAGLHTQMVSAGDRQQVIETKLVEVAPSAAALPGPERRGLPDSRVARGVEDTLLDAKRLLFRLGWVGRLCVYSHALVVIGAVSPWLYVPHQGYTPGVESWGGLPLALSLGGFALLWWRFKRVVTHKVAPVLLHLVVGAALVLLMLWRWQATREIGEHIRPELAFGFYASALGALGVLLGGLIGLKNIR
jgi:hypothetical protein